jgi:hypothetical protein
MNPLSIIPILSKKTGFFASLIFSLEGVKKQLILFFLNTLILDRHKNTSQKINLSKQQGSCITIIGLVFFMLSNAFAEPVNLGLLKKELQSYHDSGRYEQDLTTAIGNAKQYIDRQITANNQRKHKKKLALVLDIDETSLSNYDKIIQRDFQGNLKKIHQDILAANAPAIKPMLALYRHVLRQGVGVFFVTGRASSEEQATKTNLLRAGYKDWTGLYTRPDDYQKSSIEPFKARTRASITHEGYTVIATIGDQYSDLLGGFARKEFKLPNPFYYLP